MKLCGRCHVIAHSVQAGTGDTSGICSLNLLYVRQSRLINHIKIKISAWNRSLRGALRSYMHKPQGVGSGVSLLNVKVPSVLFPVLEKRSRQGGSRQGPGVTMGLALSRSLPLSFFRLGRAVAASVLMGPWGRDKGLSLSSAGRTGSAIESGITSHRQRGGFCWHLSCPQ